MRKGGAKTASPFIFPGGRKLEKVKGNFATVVGEKEKQRDTWNIFSDGGGHRRMGRRQKCAEDT